MRNTPNLREKYDVIIFPPLGGSAQTIVNGMPMRGDPIPWKASELTPNMGLSPDQTDDMRGGMGLRGVANLQKFVEDGGLFITDRQQCAAFRSISALTTGVSIQEPRQLQARGSIFNATLHRSQEPDRVWLRRDAADLFQSGAAVSGCGRRSAVAVAVVVAAAAVAVPEAGRHGTRYVDRSGHRAGNAAGFAGATTGRTSGRADRRNSVSSSARFTCRRQQRPRVVLRFASDEKNLLISGMLAGGSELANAPAVIDVPVGNGHVVMFATNPMWRHQNHRAASF